jgi:hypothetical protein
MWGIIPLLTVIIAFVLNIQMLLYQSLKLKVMATPDFFQFSIPYRKFSNKLISILHGWSFVLIIIIGVFVYQLYLSNATQISPKNVVKSYYDAIDFKEFEKAYSLIVPDKSYPLSQFLLETSVQDGILNSYAKLDAIEMKVVNQSDHKAKIVAHTKWITPLEIINRDYIHEVIKIKGKWFLIPNKLDVAIPPDQFVSSNTTEFYKHGRRAITTQQTYHDDVLKQPVLEILSAKLIKSKNEYIIIGTLQNVDNVPADVTLKASLYDKNDKQLASHNAKYVIKHKLMPKEITSFRVNFEDIAWLKNTDVKPTTFNPNEFTPLDIKGTPVTFDIQAAGNVAITDLYTSVALSDLTIANQHVQGTLFNYGIQEATIPELLVSYYNTQKELVYVDHAFMHEGVRVQRKHYFQYDLLNLNGIAILKSSLENCFVNGLDNASISKAVVPKRKITEEWEQLQKVKGNGFDYIKIELNNYIGNPR